MSQSHSPSTSTSASAATSAATSANVSRVTSLEHHEGEHTMSDLNKKSHFAKLKKRLNAVKKEWGPGLAAKECWDDEYNFPAGRWAGQGLNSRSLI
ncbi:hypothetical protein BDW71DRAFT_155481 [Aspergillus fruticulosus]